MLRSSSRRFLTAGLVLNPIVMFAVGIAAPADAANFVDTTHEVFGESASGFGASWADFDNDGDQDLYYANATISSKMFINDGNGGFDLIAHSPNFNIRMSGHYGIWGDYDNDGDLDLYRATQLWENNNGDITFILNNNIPDPQNPSGYAWGDFDADGDLDLYASNLGPNDLFLNQGSSFVDVASGPAADSGTGYGVVAGDYDDDGDLDLYVTNAGSANRLLRNDGGMTFADATQGPLGDTGQSYGAGWGDYDNDGDIDLYVVNSSSANKLLRNDGGVFVDVTSAPLGDLGNGRSVAWVDYDNDSDLDLYLVNATGSTNKLFRNEGGGVFADATTSPIDDGGNGVASAWADYDNDGDVEFFLSSNGTADKLFRNETGNNNHWLHVKLQGVQSNRSGIGARVRVIAGGVSQIREVTSGSSYASGNSLIATFGLGASTSIDVVIVEWPSGVSQALTFLPADQLLTIVEAPTSTPAISLGDVSVLEGDAGTTAVELEVQLSAPSGGPVQVDYLTFDGTATVADSDYVSAAGTVIVPVDSLSATITLEVNGDTAFEADETYSVFLMDPVNAVLSDSLGVVTIENDDAPPALSINDYAATEGDSGLTTFDFELSLATAIDLDVTVEFTTSDGSATLFNDDYVAIADSATIPAGSTTGVVSVDVVGDLTLEATETFFVHLSNATNAALLDSVGIGTIMNDDTVPVLSVSDVEVLEGHSGTMDMAFDVVLSNPSALDVTVDYETIDGSATVADLDYVAVSGTATIFAKSQSTTITVPVIGDQVVEADETLVLRLSNAITATISDPEATGTILNDDGLPEVTLIAPSAPGVIWPVGFNHEIVWTTSPGEVPIATVSVHVSRDSGATYEEVATGLPNTGQFTWLVTGPANNVDTHPVFASAIKVTAVDSAGNSGEDVSDYLFAIYDLGLTAAPDAPAAEFAITSVSPNPSSGRTWIEFTLARTAPVRLSVFDLQGREVAVLVDGVHSAGRHRATWSGRNGERPVPAGVYFVRYRTPEGRFLRRLAIAR